MKAGCIPCGSEGKEQNGSKSKFVEAKPPSDSITHIQHISTC
jgi:hypothetical protein